MWLEATTHPGLEDLLLEELSALYPGEGAEVDARKGRVRIPRAWVGEEALGLRLAHHLVLFRARLLLSREDPLGALERAALALPWPELEGAGSFRVEARREGEHPFTSPEVERRVGEALHRAYGVPVDLKRPAVRVRVDVRGEEAFLGVQLTERPLSRRFPKAALRGSLTPVLAQALLRLADARPGMRVLDPFTGSGTIALEAASTLGPTSPVYAGDLDEKRLGLAREAALASGRSWIRFLRPDARHLPRFFPEVDRILANPPHGLRLGRKEGLFHLYWDFLRGALALLPPGGRVALLTLRPALLKRALPPGFALRHARVVEQGGVYPRVFVLEKL